MPSTAFAQAIASTDARAEISQDVSLTKIRDMDFGRVIVPVAGRAEMPADDVPTCSTNNGLILIDQCQSAAFEGQAATGLQVRISVPTGRRINLTGPGADLRLRRMTIGAGDGLNFLGRTNRHFDFIVTDPAGEFEFFVGARLLFRDNQAVGLYSGTFTIEANYE